MSRKIILGISLAALVFVLAGCSLKPAGTASNEPIKIGAVFSMTGNMASFGEAINNGMNLAIEELNIKNGKYKFVAVVEDTQGDAKLAVSAAEKLMNIDQVKIILGPIRSNEVLSVAPITEAKKVIIFTPIASAEDITQAGDFVFRNRETSGLHGQKMAEFLVEKGINKVAVLMAKSANSLSYGKAFKDKFISLGNEVVYSAEYDEKSKDFRTDILKAKNSKAEAFYLAVAGGFDSGNIVKQIRELGFSGLISGSTGIASQEFLDGAGVASENVIFSTVVLDENNSEVNDFKTAYKNKYGKESNLYAANAYDAINILALAVNSCQGDKNTECLRDYLYKLKDYPGIGGKTTFDSNGDVTKPITFETVKNGQFVKYE